MRRLRFILILLLLLLVLSTVKVFAVNNWLFIGNRVSRNGTYPYISSNRLKYNNTLQTFHLSDCKDTFWWASRNMKVQLYAEGGTGSSSIFELSAGETARFDKPTLKVGNIYYYLKFTIANPLVSELQFNATWNID